jgi:hypothetical protein
LEGETGVVQSDFAPAINRNLKFVAEVVEKLPCRKVDTLTLEIIHT